MKKTSILLGFLVASLFVKAQTRMSLYEEFTGENCGPCAQTNPGLNTLLAANANLVIPIKWQVPIPSAPTTTWSLYQTDKGEIDWRWSPASSPGYGYLCATCSPTANYIDYAPQGRMDGQELNTFGINQGGSTNHPGYLTAAAISSAQSQATPFSITITPTYDATYSNATVNIVVSASSSFTSVGALKLRLVLVERAIHFASAPGSNGEKDFYDVVRKCYVTTPSGPTISDFGTVLSNTWIAAQTQTYNIVCAIPSYIVDKSQMAFVSFIQDDGNRFVWQAARSAQASIPNDAKLVSYSMPSYSCANTIVPSINVLNQGPNTITSMTIIPIIDGVNQTSYIWNGSLASTSSTNLALGTFTASAGSHTVTFNIANVSGGDVNTSNNVATGNIALIQSYFAGPVIEPFTNPNFPPTNWFAFNTTPGPTYWSRDASAGFNLAGAAKYDFYDNGAIGDVDEMYLTPSNLTGFAAPMLTFDVAYAQYSTENDMLEVKVSTDCGATWTSIYSKSGSVLATVAAQTAAFVATNNSQWRHESVALPLSAANNPSVLVKFVATSDFGNNLFVDNVNVNQNTTNIKTHNGEAFSVQLYPNPSSEYSNLDITTKVSVKANVHIYNAVGQVVFEKNVQLNQGFNTVLIDTKSLAAGVYNVVLSSENGSTAKKLTVTK